MPEVNPSGSSNTGPVSPDMAEHPSSVPKEPRTGGPAGPQRQHPALPSRPQPTVEHVDSAAWMAEVNRPPRTQISSTEMEQLRRNMSATPPGWREHMLRRFKAPIEVKAGGEWEINRMQILDGGADAGLGAKVSLGSIQGHDLQTDDRFVADGQPTYTYAEAVQNPEAGRSQLVKDVVAGPVAMADRLFDETFVKKRDTALLSEVLPSVKAEHAHLTIQAPRGIPVGPFDFSSGTTEKQVAEMLTNNPNAHLPEAWQLQVKHVVLKAEQLLMSMAVQAGMPEPEVTPRLRGFLSSVVAAGVEIGGPEERPLQTAHNYFLYEPRSTFVWRYYNNLDQQERSAARGMLLKLSDDLPTVLSLAEKQVTMFGGNMPLSSRPYDALNARDKFVWPTHDAFHESIVHGTPDEPTHDHLSNLRGYGKGYSLGAWESGHVDPSGDLDKNVAGYSQNGFKFYPSSNVLGNMAEHMYDFWAGLNPHLEQVSPQAKASAHEAFENAAKLSVAAEGFNGLYTRFLQAKQTDPALAGETLLRTVQDTGIDLDDPKPLVQWEFGRKWTAMHKVMDDLKPLLQLLAQTRGDPKWSDLHQAHEAAMACLKSEPASVKPDELESRLMALGVALFNCDGYGGNRRERQEPASQG